MWLGQSGVSDAKLNRQPDNRAERWCNDVAAELLVPLDSIRAEYRTENGLTNELGRLARRYRVSTLVVRRRVYDAGFLSWEDFRGNYEAELRRVTPLGKQRRPGGDYYNTQPRRLSKRFARARESYWAATTPDNVRLPGMLDEWMPGDAPWAWGGIVCLRTVSGAHAVLLCEGPDTRGPIEEHEPASTQSISTATISLRGSAP